MSSEDEKSKLKISVEGFDPLGLKSAGEIAKETTKFGLDAAREFLKLTCKPLLEEFGLTVRDQFTNWKLNNIIKMLERAKGKLQYDLTKEKLVLDPRVAYQIIDHASTVSNDVLQDMWAGLFASSCGKYEEDENILFIEVLKRLTSSQVKLLKYICEQTQTNINILSLKQSQEDGLVTTNAVKITYDEILSVMETSSRLKAETECGALEGLGLLTTSGTVNSYVSFIYKMTTGSGGYNGVKPTILALRLYLKGQGLTLTPFEYYKDSIADHYHKLVAQTIRITPESTLQFLYENSVIGERYKDDINFGSPGFAFKNREWYLLSEGELTIRLRPYLIYRFLSGIDKVHLIKDGNTQIGTFSYANGASLSQLL